MRRDIFIFSFLFLFLAALASFRAWDPLPFSLGGLDLSAAQHSDPERLAEIRRNIEQEIGVPYASEPSQCKLIAFGSKPCGGPWNYLVYSAEKTNESRLRQLVSKFNKLQKRTNEERKIYSDCALAPKPKLEFFDGICSATSN